MTDSITHFFILNKFTESDEATLITENPSNSPSIWDSLNNEAGDLCDRWERTEKIKRVACVIFLIATLTLFIVGFPYLAVPLFVTGGLLLGAFAAMTFLVLRRANNVVKREADDLREKMNKNLLENDLSKKSRIVDLHLDAPFEGFGHFRCPYVVHDSEQKKNPDKFPYQG